MIPSIILSVKSVKTKIFFKFNMMSHHLDTLFGHLKMTASKNSSKTPDIVETCSDPEFTIDRGALTGKSRKNSVNYISNNNHEPDTNNVTGNNHQTPNGDAVISNISAGGTSSPKKRNSMPGGVQNNVVKITMSGQMNLSAQAGQRKLSPDMRLRDLNHEDGDSVSYHVKPIKLKTVSTKAEFYDTLHCKTAKQVSGIYHLNSYNFQYIY